MISGNYILPNSQVCILACPKNEVGWAFSGIIVRRTFYRRKNQSETFKIIFIGVLLHFCNYLTLQVLDGYRESCTKVLITTNVIARGIDVSQVTVVVNFDLPVDMSGRADCETYLHRIGRTGRFGKVGFAFNMVDSQESLEVLKTIEKHFGKPIKKFDPEDFLHFEEIQKY
jgi:hypothetical protein